MEEAFERDRQADESAKRLLIVGIGASAGGIKALKEFFARVDPASGAAYAVILHLSPDHESHLAEVLQSDVRMRVEQVRAATPITPNHIYVVPPNKSLSVSDGTLTVADFARQEERRAPVDLFFRALADAHGSRSVVVILSGTGPNGSAGLKRVKEYGGLVIAQDPAEAEYADMPRNAIATGLVDLVLPVAEMAPQISAYAQRVLQGEEAPAVAGAVAEDVEALHDVLTLLRVRTGHDFSNYKTATVQRRIERRMTLRSVPTLVGYSRLIRQEPDEAVALMKELLISVTNFFRDQAAWTVIEQRVVPRLFLNKGPHNQVRVWVPGCATGEEAYSIAMLLAEYSTAALDQPAIQVFATDLDQAAVVAGREGLYTEAEVADVSEERLQRFFHREPGGFRVRRELRELVLFAHHNAIKDPPFSHLDLISCRNLLIYLSRSIQERLLETFHFALRPAGYLFLGTSETPDETSDLFRRFDQTAHVYESRTVTSRRLPPPAIPQLQPPAIESGVTERMLPADLHLRLLEQYAPPSLIVTDEHHVVHMSEEVGRYLRVRGGELSRDLLALVLPELRPGLRSALHEAATSRTAVDVRGITLTTEAGQETIDLSVKPALRDGDPARGYFLVTFETHAAEPAVSGPVTLTRPLEPSSRQVEDELAGIRERLRTTVEQYETQVEEAKASNEELQAMNEELRSAAEELETSKEELQSLNEELSTVNQELKIKIDELGITNNDFQNFVNATDIGTIFLDRSLRIKFSTPRAREVFNLLETDIGRPLSDITHNLRFTEIHTDVRQVLDRLRTIEREVQTQDNRWQLLRMLPYLTNDNRIDGVVLTFHDVTDRRTAENLVRISEERLRALVDSALDYAIFTLTAEGIIDSWNAGAERIFGYAAEEIVGSRVDVLFTPEDREKGVPASELEEARRFGRAADERYHVRKDGRRFYSSGITRRLGAGDAGFAKIARDLTAQQHTADALQQAHDDLEQRIVDRTAQLRASVVEHEIAKTSVTNLLHRLVSAQEDERRRIARDLHDHLGQELTALRLTLEQVGRASAARDRADAVGRAMSLINQVGRDIDFLSWELRPAALDELGLGAALQRFVTEWSNHIGIEAECRVTGFDPDSLPRDAQIAFYRVAQEALNNIAKHAHASRVDVTLSSARGEVVLVVEDDGIGFDQGSELAATADLRGLGVAGMRERATLVGGTLQIESSVGKGTAVFLRRPISPARPAPPERPPP